MKPCSTEPDNAPRCLDSVGQAIRCGVRFGRAFHTTLLDTYGHQTQL